MFQWISSGRGSGRGRRPRRGALPALSCRADPLRGASGRGARGCPRLGRRAILLLLLSGQGGRLLLLRLLLPEPKAVYQGIVPQRTRQNPKEHGIVCLLAPPPPPAAPCRQKPGHPLARSWPRAERPQATPEPQPGRRSVRPCLERGDDTDGNPHRAQMC